MVASRYKSISTMGYCVTFVIFPAAAGSAPAPQRQHLLVTQQPFPFALDHKHLLAAPERQHRWPDHCGTAIGNSSEWRGFFLQAGVYTIMHKSGKTKDRTRGADPRNFILKMPLKDLMLNKESRSDEGLPPYARA